MGELQHNRYWLVHRTFITRDLARIDQDDIERNLIDNLQKHLEEEINNPEFDQYSFNYKADTMKGISN